MYYKTDRKAKSFPPIRLCTFGVFIAELQVKYRKKFQDGNIVIGKQKV